RSLAYLYDDGRGPRRLRVVDRKSWSVLRSHRVNGGVSYDWVGDTLIVAQLEFSSRWTIRSDLWRWAPPPPPRGGAWTRLTTDARLIEPRAGGGTLSALKLAGGGDTPTISAAPIDGTWGPTVPSPDGRWLVAARNQKGHRELVRAPGAAAAGQIGARLVRFRPARRDTRDRILVVGVAPSALLDSIRDQRRPGGTLLWRRDGRRRRDRTVCVFRRSSAFAFARPAA